MARKLKKLKIGDMTPMWIGLGTVRGEVIGFVGDQVIIRFHINQLRADGWHHCIKDYYRDRWEVERLYNDMLRD